MTMDLGTRLWSVPAGRLLSGQAHVFDDGVALTTWRGKPRAAYRWEQVADLWYDAAMRIVHEESVGSMITQATHKLTFGFGDGDDGGERVTVQLREDAVRTLASDFFRHGIRQRPTSAAEVVVQHVRDRVASIQLPRVQEKLAAGGVVDFGVLSATADELRHGGQALPWQQVSWLGFLHRYSSRPPIDHGGFACIYYDRDEHWFDVPAAHVSNLQTLEQLFDSIPRVP